MNEKLQLNNFLNKKTTKVLFIVNFCNKLIHTKFVSHANFYLIKIVSKYYLFILFTLIEIRMFN